MARTNRERGAAAEQDDFDLADPKDQARYWAIEFAAAKKAVERWHKDADTATKRYLDERDGETTSNPKKKLSLFWSDVELQHAMMLGKEPTASAGRRFADANDDVARVAAEILDRTLNSDMERDDDNYCEALSQALMDRLLSGGALLWLRYVREAKQVAGKPAIIKDGKVLAPEVKATEQVTREDVETDHIHREDFLLSPCRTFDEARWAARKAKMGREALVARFGDEGAAVHLGEKKKGEDGGDPDAKNPWARAEVWEIWNKERREVVWYVEGHPKVLQAQPDPYQLGGFWPFPKPWFANVTSAKFVPRPDYMLARDQYEAIDVASTRIDRMKRAIKAAGVYDSTSPELKRLFQEAVDLELLPATNMQALSEKGGVEAAIQFIPVEQFAKVLLILVQARQVEIDLLYQVTGKSDLMRGQQTENGTPGEAEVKAQFGSVRIKALQKQFAKFAGDAQKIRAELMCKKFAPETLIKRSNIAEMKEDEALVHQALDLLRSDFASFRIEVKPEDIAYSDFAADRSERMEFINVLGAFLATAGPLVEKLGPTAIPVLLELLQASLSGLKGADRYEPILDRAIQSARQQLENAQPGAPQPNPQADAEREKQKTVVLQHQTKMAQLQAKSQADGQQKQLEAQTQANAEQSQASADMSTAILEHQLKTAEETHKAELAIKVAKAKPKPKPAGGAK